MGETCCGDAHPRAGAQEGLTERVSQECVDLIHDIGKGCDSRWEAVHARSSCCYLDWPVLCCFT